ncbi:MAG: HK97 gp10 family phage protein [Ketobacter sp.]|nr:HK97 gp10 family phage protein [Ketobacter sp.]
MSLKIDIDTDDIDDVINELTRFERVVGDEIERGMRLSMDVFRQAVAGHTPVNSNDLRGTLEASVKGSGVNYTGELIPGMPYGEAVEFGRKPGKPPPTAAIKMWVIRKGIATGAEADSVAFLIARAIGKRGTKGAFMFKRGFAQAKPAVLRYWQGVPARIIGKLNL